MIRERDYRRLFPPGFAEPRPGFKAAIAHLREVHGKRGVELLRSASFTETLGPPADIRRCNVDGCTWFRWDAR